MKKLFITCALIPLFWGSSVYAESVSRFAWQQSSNEYYTFFANSSNTNVQAMMAEGSGLPKFTLIYSVDKCTTEPTHISEVIMAVGNQKVTMHKNCFGGGTVNLRPKTKAGLEAVFDAFDTAKKPTVDFVYFGDDKDVAIQFYTEGFKPYYRMVRRVSNEPL